MSRALRFSLVLAGVLAAPRIGAASPGCDPQVFRDPLHVALPFRPKVVAVGDFNADGFQDIAAATDDSSSSIQVLLGNGDGTFGAPILALDFFGSTLFAADLNGDGKSDLVIGPSSGMWVALSNGDGTFQTPVQLPSQTFQTPIAGDLTQTGKLDLVSLESDEVGVFPANGDGTFGDPAFIDLGIPLTHSVSAIALGDVNGDGYPDLLAVSDSDVIVLLGAGDRTFGAPRRITVGLGLSSVAVGDLDGDGVADLGVTVSSYAEVQGATFGFLKGHGDGTFDAALETFAGSGASRLVLADADGDGAIDALAFAGAGVAALRGDGNGGLSPPVEYATGGAFAVGDFDGDGQLDVAAPDKDGVSVLLGNGRATFRAPQIHEVPFGLVSIATGDFDGDGRMDVLVGGRDDSIVGLLHGNGDGTFAPASVVYEDVFDPAVVSADFDGDGRADVAVGGGYSVPQTTILLGNGDGTFREFVSYPNLGLGSAIDVNGDGKVDLVSIQSQSAIAVAQGNGDGTFQAPIATPLATSVYFLKFGDVNGDGKPDAAVFQAGGGLGSPSPLEILLGKGDGTFESKYTYATLTNPNDVAFADVTGDGKTDLLVASYNDGLLLFAGRGDGTFDDPVPFDATHRVQSVVCGDFDGDGILDVVSTNLDPLEAVFFRGLGGGAYDAPAPFARGFGNSVLAVAPFSGAAPDLLLGFGVSSFAVILNGRSTAAVASRSVVVGQPALLTTSASGTGPLAYQWRKNATALTDGGRVTGAKTGELKIERAQFGDAGSYDVVVTDSCGTATSNVALLAVEFADVAPTDQFHAAILKVARAGITGGCGGGNYCPDSATTRAEMAVFLLRGEHGGTYQPAPATGTVFGDVSASTPFAKWIEQVAAEGITQGCGSGNYCPAGLVTRGEMAVFLLRAKHGGTYHPPAATGTVFADVPADAAFAKWIERSAAEGISSGCGGGKYCPGDTVTRGQMAAFLSRTFGL